MRISKAIRRIRFTIRLGIDLFLLHRRLQQNRPLARILLCISSPASIGGTELQVNKFAEFLVSSGFSPLVLIVGPILNLKNHQFLERLKQRGIPFLFFGNVGCSRSRLLQKHVAYLLKTLQASYFQCFNPKSTYLIPAAKEAGLQILYTETGWPIKNSWWAPISSHISSIDMLFAVSHASLCSFRNLFNYQGPGAVICSLIDSPPVTISRQRIEDNELHIVFFGRMDRLKGVELLLHAFQEFLPSHNSAHLTYIGEGEARQGLQQKVLAWNLAKHVHFLNFKEKESLFEAIVNYDLFCLPSATEGAPCALLEAMSVGLPIIATHVGGIPEMIEDGISGLLIPPRNQEALLTALKHLASHPDVRKTLGRNALKRYRDVLAQPPDSYTNELKKII